MALEPPLGEGELQMASLPNRAVLKYSPQAPRETRGREVADGQKGLSALLPFLFCRPPSYWSEVTQVDHWG